jgi:hypothetical protein
MANKNDDMPAVIGRPPNKYLRSDLDDLSRVVAKSELDLHIIRLLSLHPALKVRFRNHDIASLDDATKRLLLKDMHEVLGLEPLRSAVHNDHRRR